MTNFNANFLFIYAFHTKINNLTATHSKQTKILSWNRVEIKFKQKKNALKTYAFNFKL